MKKNHNDYFNKNPYTQRMCEYDADTTALRWVLGMDFIDGVRGPFDTTLNITLNDLIESLTLKVVSYYILLRWRSIKDNNVWDDSIIKNDKNSKKISQHPPFQFRILQMLNNAFDRLDDILELSNKDKITTKDKKSLSRDIIDSIKEDTLKMIVSFENKFNQGDKDIDEKYMLTKFKNFMKEAEDDMKKSFELWPEMKSMLEKYSYCKVNDYNVNS